MATEGVPLTIVGAGAVGRTLGRLFAETGHLVPFAIVNRSRASAASAARFISGAVEAYDDLGELARTQRQAVVMIATPDREIVATAQKLAQLRLVDDTSIVFHCSGALDSSALAACAAEGAATASVHPLATFADPATLIERFAGVFCMTEGMPSALAVLQPAFVALGARVIALSASAKVLYHAGAVFASNYLQAVLEAAFRCEALAGIEAHVARDMLAPLIRVSVANALSMGARNALTGPLARRDDELVKLQFERLAQNDGALAACYADLAAWTCHILGRNDPLARSP